MTKTEIQEGFAGSTETTPGQTVLGRPIQSLTHPVLAWLAGLGTSSRPSMIAALKRAMRAVEPDAGDRILDYPWDRLRHTDVLRIRTGLEGCGRPSTRNLSLVAVRGVARSAWRLGMLSLEELQRIKDVPNFRFHGETAAGRFVPREERNRLFQLSGVHPIVGRRDRALLGLMLGSGLRRSEAAAALRSDLSLSESVLRVTGKGGRVRRVAISASVRSAIEAWLRDIPSGFMSIFPLLTRSGRFVADRPISGGAVAEILRRRTRQMGLAKIRTHDLRRTFVSDALEGGADLFAIQQQLGHSSPATTARYDRRSERSRHAAVAAVFVPA
jgi:integrase